MDIVGLAEHVLSHSVADTLYLIPFLFVTYLAMEWLEHRTGRRTQDAIRRAGRLGPVIGSLCGVIPQCGFSASAATLYAGRVVTVGTLMAVFLSTSDEMLPIFLAEHIPVGTILAIMLTKVLIGIAAGFAVDLVVRLVSRRSDSFRIHELCAEANCGCEEDCDTCRDNPQLVYEHCDDCPHGCSHKAHEHDHAHDHEHGWGGIFKSALIHTLQITLFIFAITILLNLVLETVGEDMLESVLGGDSIFSIMVSALVGLIPNCAASIVIAQLYIGGVLGSGAMLAGLLSSAGIGLLVLCRTNRDWRQNTAIIVGLYAVAVLFGTVVGLLGIKFM